MIWTDCDREGEYIGSEIASVVQSVNRNVIVQRARFSAIIPASAQYLPGKPISTYVVISGKYTMLVKTRYHSIPCKYRLCLRESN